MTIWFDISNAPHVNLFKDMIHALQAQNHHVIITCRPLSNTIALLDLHNLEYKVVGKHYGKNTLKKMLGYPVRVLQLRKYLRKKGVDVAISQSSFHSPVVAKSLSIPSIYMNDNEHAMGNIPSFLSSTKILIPEFLDVHKVVKQGARRKKVISYPGVKEGIYLWQKFLNRGTVSAGTRDTIYIRPEPRTAQYYKGKENFLDDVILQLKDSYPITILVRDEDQLSHYQSSQFAGVNVPSVPDTFDKISKKCRLFIGAGGTMTREMAVIGVPTISVYQDSLLDVDVYLIKLGLMKHMPDISAKDVIAYMDARHEKAPNEELLKKGKKSFELIIQTLEEIKK